MFKKLLDAIGKWKSSQAPEADGLHASLGALAVLITFRFYGNVWIAAAIAFAVAVLLEVYDHFFEPPHPVWDDIKDVLFYTAGIVGGLVIVFLPQLRLLFH